MKLRALALLWCAANVYAVQIGVVELDPDTRLGLAASVEAGLPAADEPGALVAPVEPDQPLAVPAHLCAQAQAQVEAVVMGWGGGARAARLAAAAAARAGLPLLLAAPAPADARWEALALYPHPDVLAEACVDLCAAKGWQSAALLHEGSALPAATIAPDAEQLVLLPRQLPPLDDDALLRNLLLVLKKSGVVNFIVWCSAECAAQVLDAAQRVGLLAARHSYLLLTLDMHTQSLEDFSHGGANITTLQLYELNSPEVQDMTEQWRLAYVSRHERESGSAEGEAAEKAAEVAAAVAAAPPTALLLALDAARLVQRALDQLDLSKAAIDEDELAGDCQQGEGAFHADTLLNYLRSEEWEGGVSWETDGARRDVRLGVAELRRGGALRRVGLWARGAGVAWARADEPGPAAPPDSMTNRTFTVLIAINPPYVMKQESAERLTGNARYEGFCIELIDKLAQLLQFNYTFVEQEDGNYGSFNETTQQWNGMMRRLMDDPSYDFAITDLTITAERESAVDFTTPFMNLGVSILFHTPKPPVPELFAFLLPFSNGVWLCLGFAYLGSSLVLYVVGRLCPEEWQNPYPCVEEPPALENQFTLANALWFNLGAVLLQGSEIAPVAYGTRTVASMWWLFALVITSSYTANLATLLAKKSTTEEIRNVEELANNDLGITYGAKVGGSTYTFFQHSQNQLYNRMYNQMREQTMPKNNSEGIDWVMTKNFAYLMESTSIEYNIERNCLITQVGGLLDSKGYGIAMKKNSPYRNLMNLALLNLQEAGELREMKHKWWKEKHGGGACQSQEERGGEELKMPSFLGLFLVLFVGCALGLALSCVDLAWAAWRSARDPGAPFATRFWNELRFVFQFDRSEKPLQGPLIESKPSSKQTESQEAEAEAEEEAPDEERLRSMSLQTAGTGAAGNGNGNGGGGGPRWGSRRRSSMHNASLRLARHTAQRSS